MRIRYFGHSCFEWTAKNGTKIISDPFTKVGYELPKNLTADVVTVSHQHFDHNYIDAIKGVKKVLQKEKEYTISGIHFLGVQTWHDPCEGKLRGENTVYKMNIDGITLCHLGDLGENCTDELIEKIGKTDVLFIPIGGTYTINAKQAKSYIEKLSPKIVIPMHYRPTDGSLDIQDEKEFLSYFTDNYIVCKNGEIQLETKDVQQEKGKVIFMERMKTI